MIPDISSNRFINRHRRAQISSLATTDLRKFFQYTSTELRHNIAFNKILIIIDNMNLDIRLTLDTLNKHLKKKKLTRSFIICGGAALILQGLSRGSRVTADIDVVAPEIDKELKDIAIEVSEELGLTERWLNSDPKGLVKDLSNGWDRKILKVYSASNLEIYSISRQDLIFSKFWAYCDRQKDENDLIDLQVTELELNIAVKKTKMMDANEIWPDYVEEQALKLKRKLGYG